MKLASILALSASLVLAPVAQAQVSCSEVSRLMAAATEDFDSISGEEVSDDVYATTFKLNAASDCQLTFDLSSSFACTWVYDSLDAARAEFGMQSQALGQCLGEWDREAFSPGTEDPAYKQLEGVSFFQTDEDDAEVTWVAYLEEHLEGDVRDWHVWVGLDYF